MGYKKRIFDVVIGLSTFIFLSPFLLIIALLVKLLVDKPVFFRQTRPGLHGTPFIIYGDADRIYDEYAEYIEWV